MTELERVECPRCGGLEGLRQRCSTCSGGGFVQQEIEPGHETLSALRAKAKDHRTTNATQPNYNDPLWAGHNPR